MEVWEGVPYSTVDIHEALNKLSHKCLGVWWNTGRRVESLKSVSEDFLNYPGFFVQGSLHWDHQKKHVHQIGETLSQDIVKILFERIREHELSYRLEIKPTAARIASFRKTQRKYLKKFIDSLEIPIPSSWEWRIGDRGAELLLKSCSKGSAIEYAYKNNLIPADAIPVVAGDDLLDRSAMEFALSKGGYAILVGESCGWITEIPHRSSQVMYFREPSDFLRFLRGI
jgi:hydroxymethylpyrimidine pyrophosphatase-like HAD family hydrolase